ncbi:unnamed protein product [Leptidea sinapis]|uniref:Pre-C2HC domain-containing protein n=1 Tax=Leptidea sinapis TaxID=189913 RepID=A0A5E4R5L1_9NEOP|nr:unnamed protein product [Leptidea sinapis]
MQGASDLSNESEDEGSVASEESLGRPRRPGVAEWLDKVPPLKSSQPIKEARSNTVTEKQPAIAPKSNRSGEDRLHLSEPTAAITNAARPAPPKGARQAPTTATRPSQRNAARPTLPAVEAQPKKPRYPPVVIERLENWSSHFKILAEKLNRPPNSRPCKSRFRFLPADEVEYRMLQAYFSDLDKETGLEWHSYSPPVERNIKVAIRGLPSEKCTEEITEALKTRGYNVDHVKNIKARQGRPGSIFYVSLRKTPNTQPVTANVCTLWRTPQGQ